MVLPVSLPLDIESPAPKTGRPRKRHFWSAPIPMPWARFNASRARRADELAGARHAHRAAGDLGGVGLRGVWDAAGSLT